MYDAPGRVSQKHPLPVLGNGFDPSFLRSESAMTMRDAFEKTVHDDTLSRGLKARLDLMRLTGEKLVEEHRMRAAGALLSAGITLIPCEHLLDHQFAVSPGVYEAAKKISGNI